MVGCWHNDSRKGFLISFDGLGGHIVSRGGGGGGGGGAYLFNAGKNGSSATAEIYLAGARFLRIALSGMFQRPVSASHELSRMQQRRGVCCRGNVWSMTCGCNSGVASFFKSSSASLSTLVSRFARICDPKRLTDRMTCSVLISFHGWLNLTRNPSSLGRKQTIAI